MPILPCPTCGKLTNAESAVCHRCGSPAASRGPKRQAAAVPRWGIGGLLALLSLLVAVLALCSA